MTKLIPTLLCDFYKISHRAMYPEGTDMCYSTWTPRRSYIDGIDHIVNFGTQAALQKLTTIFKENFFNKPKNIVVAEYARTLKYTLGVSTPETKHIEELYDLGYLPLEVKALAEGTVVPLKVPTITIQNTNPKFFWLTNYVETFLSCELWQASTSATLANEYRKLLNSYALETNGSTDFVQFQGHDFSMRGMGGVESAITSGMGHLLSFVGTDTIPAINAVETYYNGNMEKELIGTSIPATEHSIQCAYGNDMDYFNNILTRVHPTGFVSIVSDGYDFWDVIGNVLPAFKETIMKRDGKVVIRPDSGDPVLIVCGDPNGETELERKGAIQALYELFGGTKNNKGYIDLDSHIGLIYGDAITLERCKQICERLKAKGFSSTNVVYGIGSFTYQFNTRDTFGHAMKATMVDINGKEKAIFKDPKTGDGMKKSLKGCVQIYRNNSNNELYAVDNLTLDESNKSNLLRTIYKNGEFTVYDSFSDIRKRLAGQL